MNGMTPAMKRWHAAAIGAALWLLARPALAAPAPYEREHVIDEPVFQGQAHIYEAGIGKPRSIMLVHGIGDEASRVWDAIVPWLAQDFHVVTFDLPGFGRSSKANVLYSPANYVTFIKHVVDEFMPRSFVLMGHSMGGAISLRYAATFPADVTRLVVVDAPGILHRLAYSQFLSHLGIDSLPVFYPGQKDDLGGFASGVLRHMERLVFDPEAMVASASAREQALGASPAKIAGLALVIDDFSKVLPRIKVPVLVVWGSNDPVAPVRTGRLLDAVLPTAQLTVIKAGHVPMADNLRDFLGAVQDFVRSDAPAAAKPAPVRAPLGPAAKEAVCVGKRDQVFEGEFKSLHISRCEGVRIRNARIGELRITSSSVTIDDSHIGDGRRNLRAHSSRVIMTGGSIEADTAITALGSFLDLAGVRVVGRRHALDAPQKSSVVFSICEINSPTTRGLMHGYRNVLPAKPL